MKKTILILSAVALTFASCKKEEITKTNTNTTTTTTAPDCDCDEVMSFSSFNIVGNVGDPNGPYQFGTYITINQCTGVQINGDWSNYNGGSTPYVGECK